MTETQAETVQSEADMTAQFTRLALRIQDIFNDLIETGSRVAAARQAPARLDGRQPNVTTTMIADRKLEVYPDTVHRIMISALLRLPPTTIAQIFEHQAQRLNIDAAEWDAAVLNKLLSAALTPPSN